MRTGQLHINLGYHCSGDGETGSSNCQSERHSLNSRPVELGGERGVEFPQEKGKHCSRRHRIESQGAHWDYGNTALETISIKLAVLTYNPQV